jgi:hypothetical protein
MDQRRRRSAPRPGGLEDRHVAESGSPLEKQPLHGCGPSKGRKPISGATKGIPDENDVAAAPFGRRDNMLTKVAGRKPGTSPTAEGSAVSGDVRCHDVDMTRGYPTPPGGGRQEPTAWSSVEGIWAPGSHFVKELCEKNTDGTNGMVTSGGGTLSTTPMSSVTTLKPRSARTNAERDLRRPVRPGARE